MASTATDGVVYIFGGCNESKYANANILTLAYGMNTSNLKTLKTNKSLTSKMKASGNTTLTKFYD